MRLLLDTHTLLWFLADDSRLSVNAKAAIEDTVNERWLSPIGCSNGGDCGVHFAEGVTMAIPELDEEGFLPEGVHPCTLDELRERFGKFQHSDRRIRLYEKLEKYIKELASTGFAKAIIVDGSFVTGVDEPSDIDLVLALAEDHNLEATVKPFEYNALSKRMVRKLYSFDLLVARENSVEFAKYLTFFQQVKNRDDRHKGVLRVQP